MSNNLINPLISIVLPTYNVGKYIDRALQSCVHQTFSSIEIIVVDDCGTDDSIFRAKKWAEKDSRIRIVENVKNLGTYHARRVGVENSIGEYIVFLDPDDELRLDAISLIYSSASKYEADIVFFNCIDIPNLKWWSNKPQTPIVDLGSKDIARAVLKKKNINLGTPGKAFRKDLLKETFLILNVNVDERLVFAEDVLLLSAMLVLSRKAVTINEGIYFYYRNSSSVTMKRDNQSLYFKIEQINKVLESLYRLPASLNSVLSSESMNFLINYISRRLVSDKSYIYMAIHKETSDSLYFENLIVRLRCFLSIADLMRLFSFLIGLGIRKIKRVFLKSLSVSKSR